jgi:AmmeMemoRadiSam system protein B/AmmeMemoRadiSam system protein A
VAYFFRTRKILPVLLLAIVVCPVRSHGQDRAPAVAGQFYPADPATLSATLKELFARASPSRGLGNVLAIIVPHAGYVFSGEVAASGYLQVDTSKTYDNIFVIGPSHQFSFDGASVYTAGNYRTPLGTVEVNRELGRRLVESSPVFSDRSDVHEPEHSIEVQLPFLQYVIKKGLRIVPIVLGTPSRRTGKQIADVLHPYFTEKNLFVISTDFSHYPAYRDAVRLDSLSARGIVSNSTEEFMRVMIGNRRSGTPNLLTSLCGEACVLTLLDVTSAEAGIRFTPVRYRNSGDVPDGRRDRVVGYHAIAVSKGGRARSEVFELGPRDRLALLRLARESVERVVREGRVPDVHPGHMPAALTRCCGVFVTLNRNHDLRGCIGRFEATEPLYRVVQKMAAAAAREDPRFPPVTASELAGLHIEVSVLTPMRKISSIDEFTPGKHGIYLRRGARSGTLLPQVAKETGWSREQLLGYCARDKAGLGWDGWKNAELFVYEAFVFAEGEEM